MNTLICYVSPMSARAGKKPFISDFGELMGNQTNEAPTFYAIERLRKVGAGLDRILALITPESDYDTYRGAVENYCINKNIPKPEFTPISIESNVSSADMFVKVLDKLQPDEKIILETTGGPRTAVTMLTLLSRFLHAEGISVAFSAYAEYDSKKGSGTVGITHAHELYALLEATSVFVSTGNTKELNRACKRLAIPERADFFKATREFHTAILVCNAKDIEERAKALQAAVEKMKAADYETPSANAVVFKHMLLEMIEKKMKFIGAENILVEVVQWCSDNWYLQQAVTILRECLVKVQGHRLPAVDYHTLRCLRNSINHAEGRAIDEHFTIPPAIRPIVLARVDNMLLDPNQITIFVGNILTDIRKKLAK